MESTDAIMSESSISLMTDIHQQGDLESGWYMLSGHPKIDYDEIFGEPEEYRESALGKKCHEKLRKLLKSIFSNTQAGVYYVCVVLCGIFAAAIYGVLFGLFNCFIIWFFHPWLKLYYMFIRLAKAFTWPWIRVFMDPFCLSWGQMFTNIRATVAVRLPKERTVSRHPERIMEVIQKM